MIQQIPIYRSNDAAKLGIFPLPALIFVAFVIHQSLVISVLI